MTYNFPIYTPVFIVNVGLSVWLAFMVWRYGKVPGVRVFAVMLLASGFWSFMHVLEMGAIQDWAQIYWSKVQYIGAVAIGPAWFIFTCYYRYPLKRFPTRYAVLLAILPVITVLLVWSNEAHHLIWTSITWSISDSTMLNYEHGIWFYFAVLYSHCIELFGMWNVVQVLRATPKGRRSQAKALLIGAVIPLIGSLMYISGLSPVQGMDLTPFCLTITGIIYLLTVLRFRLFDILRVARAVIIDNMRDGVLIIDEKNYLVDLNPSALQLLGVSKAVIEQDIDLSLGHYPVILDLIHKAQSHSITVAMGDQQSRYMDIQVSEINDNRGKSAGKLVVLRDVTERLMAEKDAFETAVEQHRLTLLSQFIRDISHEFRTPLSVIFTSLYLMEKSNDPDQQKKRREVIQNQAKRLDSLVSEMLTTVQLDANSTFERAPIKPNSLLQTVTQQQQSIFAAKQQHLILNPPPESVQIMGDLFMLEKALTNILQNASRYTPEGGTITVTGKAENEIVTLEICDSGVGMSAETKAHIFERFFRVDEAHTTPGFGLGLPIAQTIIEKHQGQIDVESTLGAGTTFTIRLPQITVEASAVPAPQFAPI